MNDEMIKFCKNHIEKLNKQLDEIYTVEAPEGYSKHRIKDGKINVKKEMDRLNEMEKIYSVVDDMDKDSGAIYNDYSGFLMSVRISKGMIEKLLESVEERRKNDIANAKTLINRFEQYINDNQL